MFALGALALGLAAPLRAHRAMLCGTIRDNVARVAAGQVSRSLSDTCTVVLPRDFGRYSAVVGRGDFVGAANRQLEARVVIERRQADPAPPS